jgi:transketolase
MHQPVPIEFVGVHDSFGESGTPEQLMVKYGLDTPNVIEAAKKVVNKKVHA